MSNHPCRPRRLMCCQQPLPRRSFTRTRTQLMMVTTGLLLLLPPLVHEICSPMLQADEGPAGVEVHAAGFRDRVVDLVILKDQTRLYGKVVHAPQASSIALLVRTQWLQDEVPLFFERVMQRAHDQPVATDNITQAVTDRLTEEIHRLLQQPNPPGQKIGLIRETLSRMAAPPPAETPALIRLVIQESQVRRVQEQSAQKRQLGLLAILNHVPHCEILAWQDVARQLAQIPAARLRQLNHLDPSDTPGENPATAQAPAAGPGHSAQASAGPPGAAPQGTASLDPGEAVLAAIDLQANDLVKLVRSGSSYFSEDQQPDPAALLAPLLTGQLQQQLDSLLGPEFGIPGGGLNSPPASGNAAAPGELPLAAQQLALAKNVSTALVSEFEFDLTTGQVAVHKRVFRKTQTGRWPLTLLATARAHTSELTPAQQEAVANDPRIKAVIGSLGALAGTQQLQTALHMGAAVKVASDRAEQALQQRATTLTNGQFGTEDALLIRTVVLKEK